MPHKLEIKEEHWTQLSRTRICFRPAIKDGYKLAIIPSIGFCFQMETIQLGLIKNFKKKILFGSYSQNFFFFFFLTPHHTSLFLYFPQRFSPFSNLFTPWTVQITPVGLHANLLCIISIASPQLRLRSENLFKLNL